MPHPNFPKVSWVTSYTETEREREREREGGREGGREMIGSMEERKLTICQS